MTKNILNWVVVLLLVFFSFSAQAHSLNNLIPDSTATHVAVQNGSWFDTLTWNTNTIPSNAAIVYIPHMISVDYEGCVDDHIFAIRVDGNFECKQTTSTDTSCITFDTFVGTMMSNIKFTANNASDGYIDVNIKPFDIEAHKAGTSGYAQVWNADAIAHYSDGATSYKIEQEGIGDKRYNTYADALAGNTAVVENSRVVYNDGTGVIGRYGWDSTQLSLGIITMGELEIIGQEKLAKSKLSADAPKSQKDIQLEDIPLGWKVGDTILVTRGGAYNTPSNGEDVKVIASISGTTITTTKNLNKNHFGRPSDNLHCYAGNLTRNITIKSVETSNVHLQGHLMAMHNSSNVQIKNAAFKSMGRTDKSRLVDDVIWDKWLEPKTFNSKISALGQEVCQMKKNPKEDITNSRGRYAIHLHKTGAKFGDSMVYVMGNVVWRNPGWGITHHDSYATVSDNVVYEVTGSGIVSETGSELGFWNNNLVVDISSGHSLDPYSANIFHDDYLYSGQGFGMKGRGVVCNDNVIVNAKIGVGIMNMNPSITNLDRVDAKLLAIARPTHQVDHFPLDVSGYSIEGDGVIPTEVALIMNNTDIIWCNLGLKSIERDMGVNHESRSVFDVFNTWGVNQGLSITYQADYSFKDVFISGKDTVGTLGMYLWKHSHNHVFDGVKFADIEYAVTVSKLVENTGSSLLKTRNNGVTPWYFIDAELDQVKHWYKIEKENPATSTVYTEHSDNPIHLDNSEITSRPTTFTRIEDSLFTLDYTSGNFRFEIDGIITDDLGSYNMGIKQAEAQGDLRLDYPTRIYEFASHAKFEQYVNNNGGIYKDTANNDKPYFIIEEYLPNRLTHEYTMFPMRIYVENAPSSGIFSSPIIEPGFIDDEYHLLSRLATVTQSSTDSSIILNGDSIDARAWKAIDGNNNGRINCQVYQRGLVPLGSFSATNTELEPWYDLDLGEMKVIDYIDIWNTVELNGEDLETESTHFSNFYVLISDSAFGNMDLDSARMLADYEYFETGLKSLNKRKASFNDLNAKGQYIRIQAMGTNKIQIAEIEVIGKTFIQPVVPLPVELLSFTAEADPKGKIESILEWETATEINTELFEVEFAKDGENFDKIGKIKAAGNSNQVVKYDFIHENPVVGTNYYRLKMIDFDGSYEYSSIEIVDFNKAFENEIIVYPNPSDGSFIVNFSDNSLIEKIEVFDVLGKSVYCNSNILNEELLLDLKEVNGFYLMFISYKNDNTEIKKLIVK